MRAKPLWLISAVAVLTASVHSQQPTSSGPPLAWFKGSTHMHTVNSVDGDTTPSDLVSWYRRLRYNFVVLSDHDTLTDVKGLNAVHADNGSVHGPKPGIFYSPFLVIAGEEITDGYSSAAAEGALVPGERDLTSRQVHLTAMNLREGVAPQRGASVFDVLQRNVNAVRAAKGVPIINHPSFTWSMTADDLRRVTGATLFELWSGHQQTHSFGGGGVPPVEAMWDDVLSSGKVMYGVASDDTHTIRGLDAPNAMAVPGRGWVMVRADRLTSDAIMSAMERGDFYSSSGVELADYQVTATTIAITLKPFMRSRYIVQFIGKNGRLLKEVPVNPDLAEWRIAPGAPGLKPVVYTIQGDEGYVRAKVLESNGDLAWTQPVTIASARQRSSGGK